ncbi:phospholipase D-like domain-containing protein [Coleofasciculus sp. F4-SAH-05]|uniref:phospholipase D-like domain-containing protein n=1 Tax=Coleofasciculus sp. F4-SAH-05 TaxID=3069525 RepID=UPI0032F312D4
MQVTFAIDGRLSPEHEQAFSRANGVKKLRILENIKDSEFKTLAEDILGREFVAQAPLADVENLQDKVASIRATIETTRQSIEQTQTDHEKRELEQQLQAANQEIEQLQAQLNAVPIRWLEVYEHRHLLEQALRDSQERLLIISPWIRANATNKWLIQQLEKLLKRGVKVFIGYGLGEKEDQKTRDKKAENAIKKLEQQYDNFCLKRLGDTHAKIIISDSKFAIVTSFNWLSFKGDPNRTFRDERGTLVSDLPKIQELFDKETQRF